MPQGQQMPQQASGGFFDEPDFGIVERAPEGLQWYVYIDLALGKTTTSDFNAAGALALDHHGMLYIRDLYRERSLEKFLDHLVWWMVQREERGTLWGVEDVQFQSVVWMDLMKDKRLANIAILPISPNGDKVTRARPLRLRAKKGLVKLVRSAWNLEFIREAVSFPTGRHDDQIDTASGGLQMMAENELQTRTVVSAPMIYEYSDIFMSKY